ncbi:hypothetical protein JAAARDRAFT_205846 [Jaapia argillacea MUCL 33604]|uniref:Uncharacterized protein n=1 Tax=Jaapia argillacea MUCL 33604 TaxID=933084 RepID=A0A067QBI1_9AGAM|nr:hypothetical protein JAAARDRAFT_205846 [Jaapia argillacea MUCL 33604]
MVFYCGGYLLTNEQVVTFAEKLRIPVYEAKYPSILVNAHYTKRGLGKPFIGVTFEGEFYNIWVTQQREDGMVLVDINYENFEEREHDLGLKKKFEEIGIVGVRYATIADPHCVAPEYY